MLIKKYFCNHFFFFLDKSKKNNIIGSFTINNKSIYFDKAKFYLNKLILKSFFTFFFSKNNKLLFLTEDINYNLFLKKKILAFNQNFIIGNSLMAIILNFNNLKWSIKNQKKIFKLPSTILCFKTKSNFRSLKKNFLVFNLKFVKNIKEIFLIGNDSLDGHIIFYINFLKSIFLNILKTY